MSHLDPRTAQSELEVRRIIELQNVADTLPDAFSDIAKVTRSHIPAANVPARIDVPNTGHHATPVTPGDGVIDHHGNDVASMAAGPARKRGRPIGSKDTRPRKRANEAQTNPLIIDNQNPSMRMFWIMVMSKRHHWGTPQCQHLSLRT